MTTDETLAAFLDGLRETGVVQAGAGELEGKPGAKTQAALEHLDAAARSAAGLTLPDLDIKAGIWAASLFHEACRLMVLRDLGAEEVTRRLAPSCPVGKSAAVIWSVDLTFNNLPALWRYGRQLASGDPLVDRLKQLARDWPFSSVGIALSPPVDPGAEVLGHPGLRRVYADRVAAEPSLDRLGTLEIDRLLRADLGAYPDLKLPLASALGATTSPLPTKPNRPAE